MSTIQSVMHEARVFEPSPAWVAQANVRKADVEAMNAKAERDFEGFWGDLAREQLLWPANKSGAACSRSGESRSPAC